MPKLPQIAEVKTVLQKHLPGGKEQAILNETAYHGLIEDPMVISGHTMDGRQVLVEGRPIRTSLNSDEVRDFIIDHETSELETRKAELEERRESITHAKQIVDLQKELERINLAIEAVRDIKGIKLEALEEQKKLVEDEIALQGKGLGQERIVEIDVELEGIQEEAKALVELSDWPTVFAEAYAFDDFLLMHVGHVERPLREYGGIHESTLVTHVVGSIDLLPKPIDFGTKKMQVGFFDPIDFRERETFCPKCDTQVTMYEGGFTCSSCGEIGTLASVRGGEIHVTFLTHEQKMALQGWLEHSVRVASVVKLTQEVKSLSRDKKSLDETVKTKDSQIGDMKRRIMGLEYAAGTQMGAFSISKVLYTVLLSQFGFPVVFFAVGIFIALTIGGNTVTQPLFNETSHIQTGINTITTPNPFTIVIPGLFTLVGVFLAVLMSHRHFRGQA